MNEPVFVIPLWADLLAVGLGGVQGALFASGFSDNGTGGRARLPGREAAGKTGTTSSYRDAWFIGFTEQYVTGVWMGYDDNTPLKGVTGGGLPAEIWQAVMMEIHEGLPNEPLGRFVGDEGSRIGDGVAPSVRGDDALSAALGAALNDMAGDSPAAPAGQPIVQGSGEPLADALSAALGQAAPQTQGLRVLAPQGGPRLLLDGRSGRRDLRGVPVCALRARHHVLVHEFAGIWRFQVGRWRNGRRYPVAGAKRVSPAVG